MTDTGIVGGGADESPPQVKNIVRPIHCRASVLAHFQMKKIGFVSRVSL